MLKEYFVIRLFGCVSELGMKHPEPIESVELTRYPTTEELRAGIDLYKAEYAQVDKRYKLA